MANDIRYRLMHARTSNGPLHENSIVLCILQDCTNRLHNFDYDTTRCMYM